MNYIDLCRKYVAATRVLSGISRAAKEDIVEERAMLLYPKENFSGEKGKDAAIQSKKDF